MKRVTLLAILEITYDDVNSCNIRVLLNDAEILNRRVFKTIEPQLYAFLQKYKN